MMLVDYHIHLEEGSYNAKWLNRTLQSLVHFYPTHIRLLRMKRNTLTRHCLKTDYKRAALMRAGLIYIVSARIKLGCHFPNDLGKFIKENTTLLNGRRIARFVKRQRL